MENLATDWKEFLELFLSHHVRFLLVGGHAVAIHGRPRFTEDLDLFVEASSENATRIRDALRDFGFGDVLPSIEELSSKGKVFMLGNKPYRIDLLTTISGVELDDAWTRRSLLELELGTIAVIDKQSLIANKRASGKPKDLADLVILESAEPGLA